MDHPWDVEGKEFVDWLEIPTFDGVDLTESYVLSWELTSEALVFELDVALCPDHPQYSPPQSDERTCWRRGQLIFPNPRDVHGLRTMEETPGAIDAAGERDYGNIDSFTLHEGKYCITGEFGKVHLLSGEPRLVLQH